MYDRWNVTGYDRDAAVRHCRSGLNPMVSVILASRGIEDASELTKDDISLLSDPALLKDMDRAVDRVRLAMERREHVAVYGDYDVDGITASCVVAGYLRSHGLTCDIYIPERLEEGYGVKSAALDTIRDRGASLVVSVDCGITAVEEARHAREIGLDMVITDHHECGETLPDAIAAVDPKRPDCPSPAKALAGVGVAFKLICAVEGPGSEERLLNTYGDLVACGTIADVMPVTGENRVLIKRGLERICEGRRPGLAELMCAAGLEGKVPSVMNVGFILAPRINAAGRLGRADVAVELLLTDDPVEAARLAEELCAMNRERQCIEGAMFKEALKMLEKDPPGGKPIVLASREWHQGVCGIVASKVVDRFGLPAVMICLKDGVGRGSCRSVCGFNLFDALSTHRELLLNFGGHEMAAGLTVEERNVDALRLALAESFEALPEKICERVLHVDFEVIKPELLSMANIDAMATLEPYGTGNPQPILCMTDVLVENAVSLSDGRHSKLWVSKLGEVFEAVFFSKSLQDLGAHTGVRADLAFSPQINEFRGRRSVQLNLVDFRPRES